MAERRFEWMPVMRWELGRILRRPDFVLSVLFTPLLAFGVMSFSRAMAPRGDRAVAVVKVDPAGTVLARGADVLPPLAGYAWVDPGPAGPDSASLRAALLARTYAAAAVIHRDTSGRWSLDLVTRRDPPRWTRDLRLHVQRAARLDRAAAMGLDAPVLAALDDTLVTRLGQARGRPGGNRRADMIVTLSVLMLTMLVMLTGVSYMMVGISGEKQARVTEVVMSAIPAQAWMDGKILGYTGAGMIAGVLWGASLLMIAGPLSFTLPGSIHPANLMWTTMLSVLGLYLYNAMMAALMSSAQNLQTASRWQGNFVMLPFLPMAFFGALLDNPDGLAVRIMSQVPFFSPMMVPVRLVQGSITAWELVLALVILMVSCHLMRQVAGRVFRLGMLMYGKDMTLPELLRWARTG